MAKFCEIAGKVTNCTDNCRECLEEEEKVRDIKVGDKVRYIAEDSIEDRDSRFYPPKGTIGTVLWTGSDSVCCQVKWPEGTTKWNGRWYVEKKNIELVD